MEEQICAYCQVSLDKILDQRTPLSATICDTCANDMIMNLTEPLHEFIDSIEAPILVVDGDAVVVAANIHSRNFLHKTMDDIKGYRGGNVVECVHSYEEGGCGGTEHCNGCIIRRTVMDTHQTGRSHVDVPGYLDIQVPGGRARKWFAITTERVLDKVLLKMIETGMTP